ncbi:hypothetical protein JP0061_11060 [Helicobacter pylori]|nr:hypothetical protein JP0061_11060 [Helicobacter pylori]
MILFILLSKQFEKGFLTAAKRFLKQNVMGVLECVIYQLDEETITTAIAKPASWLMLALKLWTLK